jgi:4-amino-4-deoxy-L-arabinose transferase-like glycosyltransferase
MDWVDRTKRLPWIAIFWVLLLSWIAFFHHLGDTGLLDETEPLFVEAARQMTVTGDWITPYFNGVTRFDKPPLIYWLMAIGFKIFGTNEWGARMPSAVAGTALLGLAFYTLTQVATAQKTTEPRSQTTTPNLLPYIGSGILALNLQMLFFGRTGYSDMLLNACFGGALLTFFLGYIQPKRSWAMKGWYWGFFALMGLGMLTKGPVAVVLPLAIVVFFTFLTGNFQRLVRELPWFSGSLLAGAIAVPWYWAVYQRNGIAFINAFFGFHNMERFTQVVNQHAGPWYYHFVVLGAGMLPWSVALPAGLLYALRLKTDRDDRLGHLGVLALAWFLVVMAFFAVSATKYITYSLPAVPAAAILVALWWNEQDQRQRTSWSLRLTSLGSLAAFTALGIGAWYCPKWLNDDASMPNLGLMISQYGISFLGGGLWAIVGIAALVLVVQNRLGQMWRLKLIAMAAFILFFVMPGLNALDGVRQAPLRAIARTIVKVQQPKEAVAMAVTFFEKPSLVFYTQEPVEFINRAVKVKPYIEAVRNQKKMKSILMVTTKETLAESGLKPKEYGAIARAGLYQLIRIPLVGAGKAP